MKKFATSLLLALSVFCAACSSTPAQSDAKWSLNGKASQTKDGALLLNAGAIVLLSPENNAGAFEDFDLSFNVKTSKNATGVLAFHTDSALSKGYKVAIDNSRENKVWWRKTGSLVGVRNIAKRMSEDGLATAVRVKVSGNLVEVFVNGKQLVEYAQPENPYRIPENKNAVLSKGAIAFKCDFGQIEISDFRVNKLRHSQKKVEAEPESADGVMRLHQADIPVMDYHVHLKGDLSAEKAQKQSRKYGINYGIAVNCGKDFPVHTDALALEFLKQNADMPYIVVMQAEGREWMKLISAPVRKKFAYAFTDAMTFEDYNGNRVHLWKPDEVKIKDKQAYMDMIVEKICGTVQEPADIYANATYLPAELMGEYAALWTPERRKKVLDALQKGGMALEISAKYKIPDAIFIKEAKKRGIKFTFGSNNENSNFGKLEYCLKMQKECGLTAEDFFVPNK